MVRRVCLCFRIWVFCIWDPVQSYSYPLLGHQYSRTVGTIRLDAVNCANLARCTNKRGITKDETPPEQAAKTCDVLHVYKRFSRRSQTDALPQSKAARIYHSCSPAPSPKHENAGAPNASAQGRFLTKHVRQACFPASMHMYFLLARPHLSLVPNI